MKIETQDLQDRQLQLTVEVPDDRVQAAMRAAARRLSAQSKIPGFRPGKAPYAVIVQKYGEEAVFEEALDPLGQEVYRQALERTEVEASAPGSLDEVVSRSPLVLRYTVPLAPQIDLGGYRDLRLPYDEPQVTEEAVDAFLEDLRQAQAIIEPVERAAAMEDVVIVDARGELLEPEASGPPVLMQEKAVSVLVAEKTSWPVPGVADHLVGARAGEEKTFAYTFPPDYSNESLRGRPAQFHLRVLEVKSRTVPDWSDDLARTVGEFHDLADLRAKVRQSLEAQAGRQAEEDYGRKVVDRVVEGARVTFPPALVGPEVDDLIQELDRRLRDQKLSLPDYLKIEKKSLADLRTELEPRARARLVRALVLSQVIENEHIEVSDEDIAAEVTRLSEPWRDSAEVRRVLENPAGRRRIALDLLSQKAVQRLVAIARGENPLAGPAAPVEQGMEAQ
ncbi:MAG: trigger factor [Anaerolineales bacterium]